MDYERGDSKGEAPVYLSSERVHPAVNVLVVGGDAVVGRTLKALLESTDYRVNFVAGPLLNESGMLQAADLLILAPGLREEEKNAVLASTELAATGNPAIELVPDLPEAVSTSERRLVPWPCRAEELERQMRAALGHVPRAWTEER